jgi:hypothetical protein
MKSKKKLANPLGRKSSPSSLWTNFVSVWLLVSKEEDRLVGDSKLESPNRTRVEDGRPRLDNFVVVVVALLCCCFLRIGSSGVELLEGTRTLRLEAFVFFGGSGMDQLLELTFALSFSLFDRMFVDPSSLIAQKECHGTMSSL